MSPSTLVVVNPMSAGGRTGQRWPALRQALTDAGLEFDYRLTGNAGEATPITRQAIAEGCVRVVAVGGDGTLNEVLNGFFDPQLGAPVRPEAVLGMLPSGTGGDFRRSVGIPLNPAAAAALLARGDQRAVDVGRIEFATGPLRLRHFVNIADCGIGGEVVTRVNRSGKGTTGKLTFLYHSLATLLGDRGRTLRVAVDGETREGRFSNVVIANGRYFGGSMLIAPQADVADGLFDVVLCEAMPRRRSLLEIRHLYDGSHIGRPGIEVLRGRSVTIAPVGTDPGRALFDVEGEQVGEAPARLSCLAGALQLCAPNHPGG